MELKLYYLQRETCRFITLGALLPLFFCQFVAAEVSERDFFPLYFGRSLDFDDRLELDEDFGWPVGKFEENKKDWYGAFRPFLSWGGDKEGGRFYRVLPPFVKFNWDDREVDYRVFPFWTYRRTDIDNRRQKLDHRFLPLYIKSGIVGTEDTEAYSLFYGHLQNRLGVDESEYWLFPLFLKTRRDRFINNTFLWPFFGYGSGGGGSNIRFWPIYGHKVIPKKKDARFVLWPLYGKQRLTDEDGETQEAIGSFPLYLRTSSKTRNGWTFLWPFFKHNRVDRPRRTFEEFAAPFPFYQWKKEVRRDGGGARIGGEDTLLVPPFYGHIRKQRKTRNFDATYRTLFYWDIEKEKKNKFLSKKKVIFPFLWFETVRWDTTKRTSHNTKVWPIFKYDEPEDGGSHLRIFDPLWFKRDSDMERHYSFLYTFYERERDAKGWGYDQLLGKTIYRSRYPDYSRTSFLHMFELFDTNKRGRGWSIGRGLVGYSEKDTGLSWRLLWIPFGE